MDFDQIALKKLLIPLGKNVSKHQLLGIIFPLIKISRLKVNIHGLMCLLSQLYLYQKLPIQKKKSSD